MYYTTTAANNNSKRDKKTKEKTKKVNRPNGKNNINKSKDKKSIVHTKIFEVFDLLSVSLQGEAAGREKTKS